jgi:DNA polymerase-3 subunit alpha
VHGLGGISLRDAYTLIKNISKKNVAKIEKERPRFVEGAQKQGMTKVQGEELFELILKFAGYGFNKSHSTGYAIVAYQTAYLKRHFPVEFMAALMTTEMDNTDKITKYIGDARSHGVRVLPPDVNRSQKRFSVEVAGEGKTRTKSIRFGLEAIKGVGSIAVDTILESRAAEGEFKSVVNFCKRVSTRKVNKKVLESLTLAGAFDAIGEVNRASLFASLETLLGVAGDEQEERELGQNSLFDSFGAEDIKLVTPTAAIFKQEEDWPLSRKLSMEKQTVGFYVTGHPMDGWQGICEDWLGWHTEKIRTFVADRLAQQKARPASAAVEAAPPWMGGEGGGRFRAPKTEVRLGGLMGDLKEITTKKGSRMAFASVEDLRGKLEVVFFPDAFTQLQETLKRAIAEAEPVVLVGDVEISEDGPPKILAKSLAWAREAHKGRVQNVVLRLNPTEVSSEQLQELRRSLIEHRGKCPIRIEFTDPKFQTTLALPKGTGVTGTPQMVKAFNNIFGREVVRMSGSPGSTSAF